MMLGYLVLNSRGVTLCINKLIEVCIICEFKVMNIFPPDNIYWFFKTQSINGVNVCTLIAGFKIMILSSYYYLARFILNKFKENFHFIIVHNQIDMLHS